MALPTVESILKELAKGKVQPLYLVGGDLVLAEPAAKRLAEGLAARVGCEVETHRRPAALNDLLADLKTFSLFASAKVLLVVDTALFSDRRAAADLVDQAEEGLPHEAGVELDGAAREAASRLLQAIRVFGVDPKAGTAEEALESLPKWAFEGGQARRKRHRNRPRGKRQVADLRDGLALLLESARAVGLQGFAEGDLAELGGMLQKGLPEGHALVLAEHSVATDHPLVEALVKSQAAVSVGRVEVGNRGRLEGVEQLVEGLRGETGNAIDRDALAELTRRTLRQVGDFRARRVEADSTARFAAEYRKLAELAGDRSISKAQVEATVQDRGDEDVWKIIDAVGSGRAGEAMSRYRRLIIGADDAMATRLSFFSLLAGFCRQLTATAGMMRAVRVAPGETHYGRFQSSLAPTLQQALPGGAKNPLARMKAYPLHRAYLAASGLGHAAAADLPARVLDTELKIKGESSDPDAAVAHLLARIAGGVAASRSRSTGRGGRRGFRGSSGRPAAGRRG